MSVAVVTGATGLVGSEAALHFGLLGMHVVGIDNDMRRDFFGEQASTAATRGLLERELGSGYEHHCLDVRDRERLDRLMARLGRAVSLVVHTAGQPSHDWAAGRPLVDFDVNAVGTLNVLEATRLHAEEAVVVFTSTNKVYGDAPNRLPLVERATRWEVDEAHRFANGISEDMSVDRSLHSLFGVSKLAADLAVQEYGRYFGMRTACFRAGTITGARHAAAEQHGFLAYVMRCATTGTPFTIYGYGGKQLRDVIHASDLVRAFAEVFEAPGNGDVFNLGGGRGNEVSVLEAIALCEDAACREMVTSYDATNRVGDHVWWISDNSGFRRRFPRWRVRVRIPDMLEEMVAAADGSRALV